MSKDLSGEAFDRLRAADPAAGLEPDHDALRKAVAARADVVDELAARRRRPRALQVAAASAGALAIGVGGFALGGGFAPSLVAGAESGSGSDSAASAAPAITLDGAADSPSAAMPEMATEGPAMGGGEAGRTGASSYVAQDMAYLPSFGRTVFSASGLSTSETTAPAYGYDGAAAHSAEARSEEHTSELQSRPHLVCRLLLEKKKKTHIQHHELTSQINTRYVIHKQTS